MLQKKVGGSLRVAAMLQLCAEAASPGSGMWIGTAGKKRPSGFGKSRPSNVDLQITQAKMEMPLSCTTLFRRAGAAGSRLREGAGVGGMEADEDFVRGVLQPRVLACAASG